MKFSFLHWLIKTILITGAGGRIGSAAAKALFNEGSKVILCDISKKKLIEKYMRSLIVSILQDVTII